MPAGGLADLKLTVVKKDGGDSYLPSINTCSKYLKLPQYTSKEIVRKRLVQAFDEGSFSFHLS